MTKTEISGWSMKVAPGIWAHVIKSCCPGRWIMVLDTGGVSSVQTLDNDALEAEINRLDYIREQAGDMA
jgi:hypothetical protein